jgi:hypothetical protein
VGGLGQPGSTCQETQTHMIRPSDRDPGLGESERSKHRLQMRKGEVSHPEQSTARPGEDSQDGAHTCLPGAGLGSPGWWRGGGQR